jgi:DNA mismatch repair protein MutL
LATGLPPGRPGIDAMAAPYTFSDRTPAPVCDDSRPVETDQAGVPPAAVTIDPAELVYFGKVGPSYLLFSIRGELYIVDQHAAHERILYEAALLQAQQGSGVSQKLLFPETVELSAEEYLVYESSREVLSTLGFEIEPFGHNAVIVNGMPPIFRNAGPAGAVRALLDDIAQLDKAGGDLVKSVAQSLACRAAVMAGDQLSPEEVRHLVVSLFATNNPYCCPHGRPTFIKISREELDGRFGRT